MGWPLKKLGNLTKVVRGSSPRPKGDPRYFGGNIPWVKISDVSKSDGRFLLSTVEGVTNAGKEKSRFVEKGSLIVSNSGTIGRPIFMGIDGCIHDGFLTFLNIDDALTPNWLYWFFIATIKKLENIATTGTQKNLNTTLVKSLQIPLPPLPEQRRIAQLLDQADQLRRLHQEQLQAYDELAQSVFLEMFGDPVRNEKGWEVKKIASFTDKIISGWSISGEQRRKNDGELGVLKVSAVTSGTFRPLEHKAVSPESITTEKKLINPQKGDLLFSRANTRELVAATCLVDKDYPTLFLPDKLWKIDLIKSQVDPHFFKYVLSYRKYRDQLTKKATGTSGSMLNISMAKLKANPFPIPPIKLQTHFAAIIENINQQKTQVQQAHQQSEDLFQALLQEVFGG